MAAQPKAPQKPGSRWGWMQQAVASVESKLDTILGEEGSTATPDTQLTGQQQLQSQPQLQPVKRDSVEVSRSGASTPTNDRLQARLAQAMAKKGASSRPVTPGLPAEPRSSTDATVDTPAVAVADQADRAEGDGSRDDSDASQHQHQHQHQHQQAESAQDQVAENSADSAPSQVVPVTGVTGITEPADVVDEKQGEEKEETNPEQAGSEPGSRPSISTNAKQSLSARPSADDSGQVDAADVRAQLEQDKVVQEMSDEITSYIEKIDTLQAKLKYLASEAAESVKQAAAAVQNGTAEKKLLEKDLQITLLLQEGQTLSKTEMKHLQTIKKIRQQYLATSKDHEQTRARADKAERSLRIMEDKARRAEAAAKRAEQNLASSINASNDYESIKKERDALESTLADIKAQLSRANARAEAAESKAESEQLERERKKNVELQDDLTSSKVERELAEEKLRREIKDLRASLEREKEHTRAMETEMLGEQAALESKLESFRTRAEEVSSSAQGSSQAKLLRQIETLQNQYSAASQNWQRIEGSLLARITALEQERDEVAARESEVRRKLREATLKGRKAETEVEESHARLAEVEKSQIEADEEAQRAGRRVRQLEADLKKAQQDLRDQRAQAQKDFQNQLEEERSKWAASLQQMPRVDTTGLHTVPMSLRRGSSLGLEFSSPFERSLSRRTSHLAMRDHQVTPPRQVSAASLKGLSIVSNGGGGGGGAGGGAIPESPSLAASNDADEYFQNLPPQTPLSNSNVLSPNPLPDFVSHSTVGAGPSVQLVERLSSNVRRLESEKAASRDEITRLTAQRDEARQEVVSLVREADAKRQVDAKLKELAAQHQELSQRYKTTLELLGERSEQVEELKADIVDVKAMYRQLADTIGKPDGKS